MMSERWQTDLFTFVLKRQNRRVYLVVFLDDDSRFVVGFGLLPAVSTALVLEVLRSAIASYGAPRKVLTDRWYMERCVTSRFSKELNKHGIEQVVAHLKGPQPIGKCERLWRSVRRECLERTVLGDLADARRKLSSFFNYYNFNRVHRSLGGLAPADRFFSASPEVPAAPKGDQEVDDE
jgi:transposase InsO family protein